MTMIPSPEGALSELDNLLRGTPQFGEYQKHRERYLSDIKLVLEHASEGPLLEVGSAPCHTTVLLKQLGIQVTGIDLKRFTKKVYELSPQTDKKDTFDTLTDTSMGVAIAALVGFMLFLRLV